LFIATTLEEKGLLGARYYAENPIYPLGRTVAVLNIDALTAWKPTRDMIAVGYGKSELDDRFEAALGVQGRRLRPDPNPEVGAYFRSDHFPFAEQGVPSAFVSSGYDLVEGGEPAGLALFEQYGAHFYHQPGDEWTPTWDFRPMARDVDVFASVGGWLSEAGRWPEWKQGAEFKALRERMRRSR
jgi:Zn-dependent M28 family amino/carboxypeptidase